MKESDYIIMDEWGDFKGEEWEIMTLGQTMHHLTPDGKWEFIPREKWDINYNGADKER